MRDEFISAVIQTSQAFGLELAGRSDRPSRRLLRTRLGTQLASASCRAVLARRVCHSPHSRIADAARISAAGAKFADVGTGCGFAVDSVSARSRRSEATLIESKEKKSKFLETAITKLDIANRATSSIRQFEETEPKNCTVITCRALDKFADKLPRLFSIGQKEEQCSFSAETISPTCLEKQCIPFVQKLMPLSEQRFLFIVEGKNGP